MRIFDTHAHYDSSAFASDRDEILTALPQAGVELVVDPGCDVESSCLLYTSRSCKQALLLYRMILENTTLTGDFPGKKGKNSQEKFPPALARGRVMG